MAVLDIKKCTVRICDGRKATLQIGGSGNAGVNYTLVSKHEGTMQRIKVAHVTAGLNTPLSIATAWVQDVLTITVNLATDGAGVATSTASAVRTAVNADATANQYVVASLPGTGASVAAAAAAAAVNTNPSRTVELKVGDGTLSWSESKDLQYVLDKGALDQVKEGDEQPMTLDTSFIWEELVASTGSGTPSPYEAMLQLGEAASWTSTSDGTGCPPYCVDIEVEVNPGCNAVREFYRFEEFYVDDLNPNYKDGKITFKGSCNRTQPKLYRVA